MEENSELEEGEACYYKDDEDKNVDPDIALAYIDEKIRNCLGHFQKDFEGGVSAENLGAKFGGYGSFLPAQERSPSIWSRPKTPQRSSNAPKSPNNLPVEGTYQSMKVPPNAPSSVRLGTASYSANELHSSGVVSMDGSVRQESGSSVVVGQKSTLKDENLNKLGNLFDQRSLKVRIKVSSDNTARKNAAIYSGLGLDNSPSSSLGNSLEEGGGMLPVSQEIVDNSPTSILQVMTSFPVPGCALISPLHDRLLCLIRKERPSRDNIPMPLLKGSQEHSVLRVDESVSVVGNGKLPKEKEAKLLEKSEGTVELKDENSIKYENDAAFSAKKKIENDTPDVKAVRDRLFFPDLVKEDSSESISGLNCGKSTKKNDRSSSVEKISEQRAVTCKKDVLLDLTGSVRCKGNKPSASSKAYSDASKCKEDLIVGSIASSKQKIGQQATFHAQDESAIPSGKETPLLEGKKKSQDIESSKKAAAVSTKENMRVGVIAEPKVMMNGGHGVSTNRDKMHKFKSQKDINKVRGNRRDALDRKLEQTNNQMASWERLSGDRAKDFSLDDLEIEQNASSDKSKERFIGKRVDNLPISGASIKDAADGGPCNVENALANEVVPPVANHVVIQENWVCCDSCQTWRLLPYDYNPEQLPEKWLCSMQTWLSRMNRCDISEEETTKALNAVYQRTHANGIGSGVTTVHVQHLEQNHQIVDSHALSSRGKKKHGFKEVTKAGSSRNMIQTLNPANNQSQESVKSRSLNDMNRHPAEPTLTNKSSAQHLSKSHHLVAEEHISKQKENHMNGAGESKQVKMKNKREADHDGYGTSKKAKTENVDCTDKHQNFDVEPGMVGLNSKSGLSTKASGMNTQKSNKYSLSEDMKCDSRERLLVSVKKLGDQAQVSSDGGFLDIKLKTGDKRDISLKKRKLLEWQDNQNGKDSNTHVEESSENGLKKEKKSKVSKTLAKESSTKSAHDKLNKKGRVGQILLSGHGMEEGRIVDKDEQLQKDRKNFASQQTFGGRDLVRKDVGSGQVSMTATSSSSKVLVSLKTRATFDDVKGSPEESVSSSPLRTSMPEKRNSAGGDVNGGVPVIGKVRRSWNVEVDGEVNRSGTARKEKVSDGSHPEPLNFFPLDYQDGDDHKLAGKAKPSSDLLNGDAEIIEHRQCSSDLPAIKNCHDEDRVDKNHSDIVLFPQKSHKSSSLWSKDKDRSSTSDFNKNKMKISNPVSEQADLCSKKSTRHESETDSKSHAPFHEGMNNFKHSIPDTSSTMSSKDKKDHVNRSDSVGQCSKDSRTENQLKVEECDYSDAKLDALCGRNWNATPQQNLIRDFGGETKTNPIQKKSRSGTPKLFSDSEGQGKQESQCHVSVMGSQKGGALDGLPVHASGNGDVSRALKHPGDCGTKNGAHVADIRGFGDLNAPSPGRTNSSGVTATNALKEGKDLRDYADRLKSSGFGFESNEAYFQAALKFLHGASLLETCNSEGGKRGDLTQMQAYSTTAKLCKTCALEYESRSEMAAAALAYKCMEVAYWRVVCSKNSASSRDHSELQASVQMIPQGESPSSSASDVDNLNNQAIVDKATLSKGTASHVAGNPVIVARNRSNFLRLLDFTHDVNFAVDASIKSQNAFSAANVALEEAQNRDCITSVKKVIDFSFQDVVGFIHLVQLAMKAISHPGFGGARD